MWRLGGDSATQVNSIVSHPTMPMLVTAHEDKHIRVFDIITGERSCHTFHRITVLTLPQ